MLVFDNQMPFLSGMQVASLIAQKQFNSSFPDTYLVFMVTADIIEDVDSQLFDKIYSKPLKMPNIDEMIALWKQKRNQLEKNEIK
eukprot:CAMPEP_0116985408 /NCGR_PEP_ID=MMETSP0467-20121206/62232_1 /TAXON_ID=283647 /ORGANISM="Mesodinium pulex, Strain SPMC105" /LENGTH=84 /DNA_ID=CAMNT_0004680709 /DNA_START=391 /DNA_END=645 /DNA_ORIENTATION=+